MKSKITNSGQYFLDGHSLGAEAAVESYEPFLLMNLFYWPLACHYHEEAKDDMLPSPLAKPRLHLRLDR